MSGYDSHAEPGTVELAGVTIPVREPVRPANLATFPTKVTIGDHTKDSDSLLSAWIQSNFTGGVGTETLSEDVDNERFWFGTLDTRHPHQLALRTETVSYAGPPGATQAYPLGDFQGLFYAAFDTTLMRYNVLTDAFEGNTVLPSAPVNKPVVYKGRLYTPHGASGYTAWDGTNPNPSMAILPVAFCLWDDKLLALTTAGALRIFDGTSWPAALPALTLAGSQVPRHLVVFVNQAREPAVYLVTDRDLWVYDPDVPRLYPAGGVFFPPHPDHGLGASVWRGDTLYLSVGVGIHNFNGAVFSTVGLDESDGLPASLRGAITDLEPEYNSLIAVVRGIAGPSALAAEEPSSFDAGLYADDPIYGMGTQATSSVMAWSQIGWHTLWLADVPTGTPTWARVSAADSAYRLWWGYGPLLYTQDLRRTFHTPKQGARVGIDRFAATGWLETGRFDAAMRGFTKLASHFEVHLEDVLEDGTSTGTVTVQVRTDRDPAWRQLGEASLPGRTVLPFGLDRLDRDPELPVSFAEGEPFGWVQFRYTVARTAATVTHTPVVDSFVLKFLKLPLAGLSWTLDVLLDHPELFGPAGMGPQQIMDYLDGLTTTERFYPLIHRGRRYRVRVARTQGDEQTGFAQSGTRQLVVVLVPISGDALFEEVA